MTVVLAGVVLTWSGAWALGLERATRGAVGVPQVWPGQGRPAGERGWGLGRHPGKAADPLGQQPRTECAAADGDLDQEYEGAVEDGRGRDAHGVPT